MSLQPSLHLPLFLLSSLPALLSSSPPLFLRSSLPALLSSCAPPSLPPSLLTSPLPSSLLCGYELILHVPHVNIYLRAAGTVCCGGTAVLFCALTEASESLSACYTGCSLFS